MTNRIRQINQLGQAIWLDFISRELLASGQLLKLVQEGVTGVTSNPTIFHKAVAASDVYDAQIERLARLGRDATEIYEALAVDDIREAADQLRGVYNETHGRDGFVSIEVSPHLASDTTGTLVEARRLFSAINQPNVMIKVPATVEGLPAITALIGEGINVNVTLIFGLDMYDRVMQAYVEGLERLSLTHRPLASVSSVASFFVSRVDTVVDAELTQRSNDGRHEAETLFGKAAVANAKLAYAAFKRVFNSPRFAALRNGGARVQRPLWASTSTKNPAYSDVMYVDPLIGLNTVNTMPPQTLDATRDHAHPAQSIEQGLDDAHNVMSRLESINIDMKRVTDELLTDGLRLFADSFDKLLADIDRKRRSLVLA